jgi:DNA repair protein RadC
MKELGPIPTIQIHYARPPLSSMYQILCIQDAEQLFRSFIDTARIDLKEFFWVMLLTHSHHVLGISEIAVGDTGEVAIPKKEIFQLCLAAHSSAVILCHNHPSGSLNPSPADIALTKDLVSFGELVDVKILDHLILTSEDYYSLAEHSNF